MWAWCPVTSGQLLPPPAGLEPREPPAPQGTGGSPADSACLHHVERWEANVQPAEWLSSVSRVFPGAPLGVAEDFLLSRTCVGVGDRKD